MLRFYHTNLEDDSNVTIDDNPLIMDSSIWLNCRRLLKEFDQKQYRAIHLVPVKDANGGLMAYGYQDDEANREIRMLRELKENAQALQFTDVFPEYEEVLIWGCNELAVRFAEYLKQLGIVVTVTGQYWDLFGYKSLEQKDLLSGRSNRLIVYAEGSQLQNYSLYETVIRSASPEFECIDKIYEANVLEGRICDTIGDFDVLISRLKDEHEIIILGADMKAQDTYDLLMAHGIDICCFAVQQKRDEVRLGKRIMSIGEVMSNFKRPVFLNYTDVHGALGEKWTEYFDYRGYERNKQYFLVKDYADIPTSNLVHVLHGKNVLLTGDVRLCQLLSEYLNLIEDGEVTVQYTAMGEKVSAKEEDILCLVVPEYSNEKAIGENKVAERREMLRRKLSEMGFAGHTEYFVCSRCFALIDLYLNKGARKYTVAGLMPKGILLGRIPSTSGNIFFRGIMDGHPEVLLMSYSDFNNNLFYYCVRLANIASEKVMPIFWEMYDAESGSQDITFPNPKIFEARARDLLALKESFTSQELFVLFHIAYMEMNSGRRIADISTQIIYWEPHKVNRNEFPYFALWLEDQKVNGNTILLCRNNMVKAGSSYNFIYNLAKENIVPYMSRQAAVGLMFVKESIWDGENIEYQYWTEYKMRFEDIKTKPMQKLMEVCKILDIAWADSMLQTTNSGKPLLYSGGVSDFDLKPVFNKYEDYFSEFDRFRISIASSPYQKRYGYTYDNCLKFTRRELQEMFFKPFLFDEKAVFIKPEPESEIALCEWIRWQLWNVRIYMVSDDVPPEFDRFELETTGEKRNPMISKVEDNK